MGYEGWVNVPGGELYVREDGDARNPCVVLLGSLAADTRLWDDQLPGLASTHRVLRYDYRGHGHSRAEDANQPMEVLLDDLLAVLASRNVTTATLVGISLGGMIAMEAALRDCTRFPAIVVAAALADMPTDMADGWDARADAVLRSGMGVIADETLARWFTPAYAAGHPGRWQDIREMILETTPAGYAGCIAAIRKMRLLARLGALRSRSLFVVGDLDSASTPARMRQMAVAAPGSRLQIIEGAAHLPNVERAAAFNEALDSFL